MRRLHIGWLLLSTLALVSACSGGRSNDIGDLCGPDAGSCPVGTSCQDGRCVEQQPSRTSLSASGRPEGAIAAIEWVAEDGVSCVQSAATTCTVSPGSRLTLKAPTVPGFRFDGWHGPSGCASVDPALVLVVQTDVECVARYVPRVKVTGSAEGGDIVVRSDSPFAVCSGGACEVDRGARVELEAPQRDGFRLGGWEGEGCQGESVGNTLRFAAERDTACQAMFIPSLTVRGVAAGAVATISAQAALPTAHCAAELCAVDPGDEVQLVAAPVDGFRFVGWNGDDSCAGSEPTLVVRDVRASITCTANYIARYTVRGASSGAEPAASIAALSSDAFALCSAEGCVTDEGGAVTLVAPSVAGYRLRAWTGEGCQANASGSSTTLGNLKANLVCTADYVRGVAVTGTLLGATEQVIATSASPGAACANGGCSIDAGGTVTLTVPTLVDRTFLGWSGDPGCTGTNPVLTLADVTTSKSCTARLAARYQVSGTATPAALGNVTATSSANNSRCTGGVCTVDEGATVTLVAAPQDAGSRFIGWSGGGGCTGSAARLVLADARANLTCRATFVGRATLGSGVTPSGSGSTTASSVAAAAVCTGASCTVDAGSNVNVRAVPADGYRFVGWSDCSSSLANPLVLSVTGPTTCTARMERLTHLVIASAGAGGSVSASVGTQACAGARCSVLHGDSATVSAAPSAGFSFAGWSGCDTSASPVLTVANVTSDQTCVASFSRMRFTVSATAGAGGSVTASIGNTACANASCSVDFGGSVTLQATPAANFSFGGWSCGGASASLSLTNIMANRSCAASFTRNSFTVNASAGAGGSLRVTPGTAATCTGSSCTVLGGGDVSFVAVPATNFGFTGWTCSVGTPASSASATLAFSAVSANHTCTASFARAAYVVTVVGATGLTVQGSVGAAACAGNVCTVAPGASVALLAFTTGTAARIFTGWTGCTPSAPSAVAGRTDLAFSSTLDNINSDQTCTAGSDALAVVLAFQQSGTGTPVETIDLPHVCVYGVPDPREAAGGTLCRVAVSARVSMRATVPAGRTFRQWECWTDGTSGNSTFTTVNPLVVTPLAAGVMRDCEAYFN